MLKVLHSIVKQIEKTGALPCLVPLAPWSTRCNLTVVFGSPLWARVDYWRILCLLSRLNRLRWAVNLQSVQMSSLAGLSRGPRQAESARDCLSLPKDSKISNTVYGMAATMVGMQSLSLRKFKNMCILTFSSWVQHTKHNHILLWALSNCKMAFNRYMSYR